MVVHSAPLAELETGEQDARLNLAEILAGWRADHPDLVVVLLAVRLSRDSGLGVD